MTKPCICTHFQLPTTNFSHFHVLQLPSDECLYFQSFAAFPAITLGLLHHLQLPDNSSVKLPFYSCPTTTTNGHETDRMEPCSALWNIKYIYPLTDCLILGDYAQSDNLSKVHHSYPDRELIITYPNWFHYALNRKLLAELDSRLQGIFDKLVCMHANCFLTPPLDCQKPTSSWTATTSCTSLFPAARLLTH